ncbi:MAG: 50S ribosomal protein L35 [Chloroflexi bacterium]|nr:50S ribosomal protein L35 [Chloroflexota bacterium]
MRPSFAGEGVRNVAKKQKKYKLKTHKATAKRFRVTGSGKLMRTKGGKSHLRRRKSARVKRQFDRMLEVSETASVKRVRKLAPYLGKHKANPPA